MPRETFLTATAARLASLPFRLLARRSFAPPNKVLILKPCCMSQAMLTTPLLAAFSETYPRARIDWAISDWARPAVVTNPRICELRSTGRVGLPDSTWSDVRQLVQQLSEEEYDTCLIPSRSSILALVAWLARIPQRVGLSVSGRGFAHTVAVRPPAGERNEAAVYLSLAQALGIDAPMHMEFYPPDADRAAATHRLMDELGWTAETPLVLLHPGGGANPVWPDAGKRWPVERLALLGNHLVRHHNAQVLVVGAEEDRPLAQAAVGLMSAPAANLAGQLSLGELGATCELASLYVGNDAGPTHVAAAVGCPTLAIYGPTDPAVSAPYAARGRVVTLWRPPDNPATPFSWTNGVTVAEAIQAADDILLDVR